MKILLLSTLAGLIIMSVDAQANIGGTANEAHRQRSAGTKQEEFNRANSTKVAQGLGLDSILARRKSSCISNDLQIGCRDEPTATYKSSQFYIDWNHFSRTCFITHIRPVGHVVTGGGPFDTRDQAMAAIKSIGGCK